MKGPQYEYKIVICNYCKGEGKQYEHVLTCYHRNEYDVITHECKSCKGHGRLRQKTTHTFHTMDEKDS